MRKNLDHLKMIEVHEHETYIKLIEMLMSSMQRYRNTLYTENKIVYHYRVTTWNGKICEERSNFMKLRQFTKSILVKTLLVDICLLLMVNFLLIS